jgi:hypothetical protein
MKSIIRNSLQRTGFATHRLSGIGNHAGDDALKAVQVELIKANLKLKQA